MDAATSLFSSLDVRPAQQFERFREAVSATHLAWDMAARRTDGFLATIRGRALGPAAIVGCACDPCHGRRGRPEVARTARATFGVLHVLSGRERVAQGRGDVGLDAGTFTLWDATEPLSFEVPGRLRKLTLLVPEEVLVAALPEARAHLGVAFDGTAGPGALFVSHLKALEGLNGDLAPAAQEVALRVAVELLAATVLAGSSEARPDRSRVLLAEIMRHARANLGDPALDAGSIARAVRLSRRQVDRVFAATGQTLTRWIWRERVLRCRRDMVLSPRASLTDIAFRWGFSDAAHFSRVFRRELGVTPREHRARALSGVGGDRGSD